MDRRSSKRALDLCLALPALILLWPVMAILSLLVMCLLGRPVLFRQARPGLHGRIFSLYKFVTMKEIRDEDGNLLPDAERLTPLGRFMRATSLDELPELWNVVRGDMSFVGPRPLLVEYLPLYSAEQARRHEVKPGITGWAQVNGRNAITWEEKFRYDVWYVDHWNLRLDAEILRMTLVRVLKRDGINQPGNATMEKFRGK